MDKKKNCLTTLSPELLKKVLKIAGERKWSINQTIKEIIDQYFRGENTL